MMVGNLGSYLLLTRLAKAVGGPWVLLIGLPLLGALAAYGAQGIPQFIRMCKSDERDD